MLPYAVGGLLIHNGFSGIGAAIFGYAVLRDWKWWLLGVVAFFVGFHWGR